MVSLEELDQLQRASVEPIDRDDVTDMQNVVISGGTPAERLESLLKQVDNPYCYRVGNTVVRVSFLNSDENLSNKLQRYLISLKTSDNLRQM